MPTNGFATDLDLTLLEQFSDVEFLQALEFEKAASKELVRLAKEGDTENFFKHIEETLSGVDHSKNGISTENDGFVFESLLSLLDESGDKQFSQFVSTFSKIGLVPVESPHKNNGHRRSHSDKAEAKRSLLSQLEKIANGETPHPVFLAIFYELILHFSASFSSQDRFRLWRLALTLAIRFYRENFPLSKFEDREDLQLLIEGELAWKTGLLFAGLKGSKNILHSGRKYLGSTIEARTDTDGTPHADLVPHLAKWLACFVRADLWAEVFDELIWDEDSEDRFQSTVRRIASLCGRNGDLALGIKQHSWSPTMLQVGISQAGWRAKSKPAQLLREIVQLRNPGKPTKSNGKSFKWNEEKSPMFQSDWAAFAGLRSDWSHRADAVFVTHNETIPQIALMADGISIFSGDWHLNLDVDEKPISLDDDWDCSCWFTDKDVDFIELHQEAEGVKIDRQIFLSRTDRFAIFADCICGPETSVIDYTSALPVTQNVTFQKEKSTRECSLKTKELKVRCFPLLLPEDRIENAGGDYRPHDTGLRLEYKMQGGVFAPQVFDWSPRRKRGHAEWRQLTVTEDGKVMKKHIAGGYRLRLGNQNLLLYRSLKKPDTGRAFLGHHTRHETVYGNFSAKGEVDPLLLVE